MKYNEGRLTEMAAPPAAILARQQSALRGGVYRDPLAHGHLSQSKNHIKSHFFERFYIRL